MCTNNFLLKSLVLCFMLILFVNTDTILYENTQTKYYYAIVLVTILTVFFSINLIFRKKELLTNSIVTVACIDANQLKPVKIPTTIKKLMELL